MILVYYNLAIVSPIIQNITALIKVITAMWKHSDIATTKSDGAKVRTSRQVKYMPKAQPDYLSNGGKTESGRT